MKLGSFRVLKPNSNCSVNTVSLTALSPRCLHKQLRNLVDMCINPDPEKRPDITYVYDMAKHMQNMTQGC